MHDRHASPRRPRPFPADPRSAAAAADWTLQANGISVVARTFRLGLPIVADPNPIMRFASGLQVTGSPERGGWALADQASAISPTRADPPGVAWLPSPLVEEVVLSDAAHRRVVRVGDTVRRPDVSVELFGASPLEHLERVGFGSAPRFLGIDDQGREVLEFIDGIAGADGSLGPGFGAHVWAMVVPDEGLARFARLVRDFHDAVGTFTPPAEAAWATGTGPPCAGEIVCHNDIGPWNVVWREGSPVCILDWDYAAPANPLDDVAFALEWSVPFASDEECVTWRRFSEPPDRRHRLEVFAAAYGLTQIDGLVDAVTDRQRKFRTNIENLAARGIQPAVDEVASGYLDVVGERIQWSITNRTLLQADSDSVRAD